MLKNKLLIIIFISVFTYGCSSKNQALTADSLRNIIDTIITQVELDQLKEQERIEKEQEKEVPEPTPDESETPKPEPTPEKEEPLELYIPNNCSNPPANLKSNDGFKCMASTTRGGSVVCLLPYPLTWKPWKMVTDHHNNTFACNKADEHFDKVILHFKGRRTEELVYAGCHNYVATSSGWIGRQHFRNEDIQWDSIKDRVDYIEMIKNGKSTCLSFLGE